MAEYKETSLEKMRAIVGRFGITGSMQTMQIRNLSDGLKSRVVLSWLATATPHMLLLDEPTNHLDIETIDSLAHAINSEHCAPLVASAMQCIPSSADFPPWWQWQAHICCCMDDRTK